jgi:cell division transport system ATP-binding protein
MQIVFKHLSKNYGLISALKDIDFTVKSGEFVFLSGPSGSGKTTIMKLILSQIQPSQGDILIGEYALSGAKKKDIDDIRKKIGVIFQDYQLVADKSLEENIALVLDIVDYPGQKIQSRIDQVIEQVGLSNRRFLYPSQLSGGELQRAALARALAIEPKIILADEPTGNLDSKNSWNLVKLLKEINQKNHCTIIMSTHDDDIVKSLGKRVISLKKGQIINSP